MGRTTGLCFKNKKGEKKTNWGGNKEKIVTLQSKLRNKVSTYLL